MKEAVEAAPESVRDLAAAPAGVPVVAGPAALVSRGGISNAAFGRGLSRQPQATMPPPAGPNKSEAPPPAATRNNGVRYDGEIVYPEQERCKELLYKLLPTRGREGAHSFGTSFARPNAEEKASRELFADAEYQERCQKAMEAAAAEFDQECERFTQRFETKAGNTVDAMLLHAKKTITAEQAKLGVKATQTKDEWGNPSGTKYEVGNKAYVAEAKKAAAELAPKRSLADHRAKVSAEATKKASEAASTLPAGANPLTGPAAPAKPVEVAPGVTVKVDQAPEHEQARRDWQAAEQEFAKSASAAVHSFPILGPLLASGSEAADKLKGFATDAQATSDQTIGEQLAKKLENIETVHGELGKRFSIYKQPTLLDLVHEQMGSTPGERKLIHDKAKALEEERKDTEMMYAAVAIGLGLLAALPTGGSSAIAAVAAAATASGAMLSAYTAFDHVQEYRLQSAAANTALERADVISKDDPSLLFLAMDIAVAFADLSAAKAAFLTLKESIAAARAAKSMQRLPELLTQMNRAAISPTSQGKLISQVFPDGGNVVQALDDIGKAIRTATANAADQQLGTMMRSVAENAIASRRVVVVPAERAAAEAVLRERLQHIPGLDIDKATASTLGELFGGGGTANGVYMHGNGGYIVLMGNESADVAASVLIHELTHRGQDMKGIINSMGLFQSEFQAFKAQQQFLKMLPPDRILGLRPEYQQLVHWTDSMIELHVVQAYKNRGVQNVMAFDPSELTDGIFKTLFQANRSL